MRLILIIIICIVSINTYSQYGYTGKKKRSNYNYSPKNSILLTIGIGGVYGSSTMQYERILSDKTFNKNISSLLKIGGGAYAVWGSGGGYALMQYGILTGKNRHHLEFNLGPAWYFSGGLSDLLPISSSIGWRIQKPKSRSMFRIGIGLPEALYIGGGFSF